MIKRLFVILGLAVLFFLLISNKDHKTPLENFDQSFKNHYSKYLSSIKTLANTLKNDDFESVDQHFKDLRYNFKKIELVVQHLDQELHKKYINGAPLPWLTTSDNKIMVADPEGLQVIDELIAENDHSKNKDEILIKLTKLYNNSSQFKSTYLYSNFTERDLFEALRKDIIRIMSLDLTGYGAPATLNSLNDIKASLEIHEEFLDPYLSNKKNNLTKELTDLYNGLSDYFEINTDYNSFDRLHVTREYLNPIYAKLYDLHIDLGIETIDEITSIPQAWNYHERNLFSDKLINKSYSTLQADKYNEKSIVELGKKLFFDPILSTNNQRACASCHRPELAFTDGMEKSTAIDFNGTIDRNAMGLINCTLTDDYFYDFRATHLEAQFPHVIANKLEFNTTYKDIVAKLNKSEEYKNAFKEAFQDLNPDKSIDPSTIEIAIAQYVLTLNSFNSPFDKYVRGEIDQIDGSVKRGFNLFMGKALCGTCHFAPSFAGLVPPNFTDMESEILGVPEKDVNGKLVLDDDPGRMKGKVKDESEIYNRSFKTVTVRNVELTAPYMHNGVYKTLEEVMDFYNKGGGEGLGFDVPYQTLPFDSLSLTGQEIIDIIAFMRSLTDTTGMTSYPTSLPKFENDPELNNRKIGGEY